jgi:MFS family permease
MREVEAESGRGGRVALTGLLIETSAVQALGTLAVLTIPALAPMLAPVLGVPTSYVGYQVATVYFVSMLASLCAGAAVGRFGPCRIGQVAMLLNAAGCMLAGSPDLLMVALGSITIGAGYGLINPAASELLMRHGPPHRRALIFSLKQTGVPVGGMVAGLVVPGFAIALGWQTVLWTIAGLSLVAAAASQPHRALLDRDRRRRPGALPFRTLALVMTTPALRWLILSSMCFSGLQLCVVEFLVVLLVEDLHYDLVTAGAILGAIQITGLLGRVMWGYLADLIRNGVLVLLGLGVVIAAASAAVTFGATLPPSAVLAAFMLLGLTSVGWNGVFLSEVARLSPAQSVSAVTGAAMFFTFTGVLIGPSLFSFAHHLIGSYLGSYVLVTGMALLSVVLLMLVLRRQ